MIQPEYNEFLAENHRLSVLISRSDPMDFGNLKMSGGGESLLQPTYMDMDNKSAFTELAQHGYGAPMVYNQMRNAYQSQPPSSQHESGGFPGSRPLSGYPFYQNPSAFSTQSGPYGNAGPGGFMPGYQPPSPPREGKKTE